MTPQEWRIVHGRRCAEVKLRIHYREAWGGYGSCDASEQFCSPESPCDGCREWARRQAKVK